MTDWNRLAVLVDCARVWAEDVEDELEAVIERAERVDGRVYHSWSWPGGASGNPSSRAAENSEVWAEFCERHQFEQVEAPQISATGIRITLDALDLDEEVDAVCIMTVSHQLGPLVERLRQNELYVVGLSNWRSKDEFRDACDEFKLIDDRSMSEARKLAETHRAEGSDWETRIADLCDGLRATATPWVPLPLLEQCVETIYPEFVPHSDEDEPLEDWLRARDDRFLLRDWRDRATGESTFQVRTRGSQHGKSAKAATGADQPQRESRPGAPPRPSVRRDGPAPPWEELITEALQLPPHTEDGWIQLPQLGQRLRQVTDDWSPKRYGADKLLDLLDRREDLFEVDEEMDEEQRKVLRHWVRLVAADDRAEPLPPPPSPPASEFPAPDVPSAEPPAEPPGSWQSLVADALQQPPEGEDGWLELSGLEERLQQAGDGWSPQRYGADDLLDLLDQRQDLFEIEEEMDDAEREVLTHWIRLAEPEEV